MTDPGAVLVGVAAFAGALAPLDVPVAVALVPMGLTVAWQRALPLALAVGLLAATLSHQAWAGLASPESGPFHGVVVLASDPEPSFGGWEVDARTSLGRLEVVARGGAGGRLSTRQAGERVQVTGRVEGVERDHWTAARHVRGRVVAERVAPVDDGTPLVQLTNGVRSLVVDGSESLPPDLRALFTGFVLGDDRGASTVVADDFEAAGLSHLLVVSGQNVVFVLAVAAPLVGRLPRRGRFVATAALLLLFAAVTRFEPSVLRATVMAGIGAAAALAGRPVGAVRVLALAVTGLVLVDPLLVLSLGFRLSVAASAGIVVLARPLAAALPGPTWLRVALAVTLSAQAAVAPLLVPAFGPMPVAAVPANLLAEPVAGLVMMWGCTAGVVAGVVPDWAAAVLHVPTRLGLWWVAGVARICAGAPLGAIGLVGVGAIAALLGAAALLRSRARLRSATAALVVAAAVVVCGPFVTRAGPDTGSTSIGGAELWRGSGERPATVLVVPGDARADDVLAGLRTRSVDVLDLVILRSDGPMAASVLGVVRQRVSVRAVWAPSGSPATGATVPAGAPMEAGGLRVATTGSDSKLEVQIEVLAPGDAATTGDRAVGGPG